MTPEEILSQLNPEQAQAASTVNGPVLVLAGAGTGKTRVITYRIAYMLSTGIPPEAILGMTFTNKAAREMRERLAGLVDPKIAEKVTLGTFHSFCIKLLHKYISKLGYLPAFSVADESDQQGIFKQACGMLGCNYEGFPHTAAFAMMSQWKNKLIFPQDAERLADTPFESQVAQIYDRYQELLEQQNSLDFDDMLLLVYRIFDEHPDVLKKCQERYRYLLIDEYQDTNTAQFTLVKMLAGESCNLCVVGDDDQSIYSWRGAEVSNILEFPDRFPGTKVVKLEQNYRSCTAILDAANMAINSANSPRHGKKLWSALGQGKVPQIIAVEDGEKEAEFITDMISQLKSEQPELTFDDFAVLYRSNQLSRQLEMTFRKAGVPYRMIGGQQFFARREIKDAIAYLKLLLNPRDDQSLLRILSTPPRGFGNKAVELLKQERQAGHRPMLELLADAAFQKKLSGTAAKGARDLTEAVERGKERFAEPGVALSFGITEYLKDTGYVEGLQRIYKDLQDVEKRRDNIDEFISDAAQYQSRNADATLADYIDLLSLKEENDQEDGNDGQAVTFSTIHAAKGLEYPIVFLVALERNIFPHERALKEGGYEEELRLFYVAVTRAKRELYMTRAQSRMMRGVNRTALPSPFLELLGKCAEQQNSADLIKTLDADDAYAAFSAIYERLKKKAAMQK